MVGPFDAGAVIDASQQNFGGPIAVDIGKRDGAWRWPWCQYSLEEAALGVEDGHLVGMAPVMIAADDDAALSRAAPRKYQKFSDEIRWTEILCAHSYRPAGNKREAHPPARIETIQPVARPPPDSEDVKDAKRFERTVPVEIAERTVIGVFDVLALFGPAGERVTPQGLAALPKYGENLACYAK